MAGRTRALLRFVALRDGGFWERSRASRLLRPVAFAGYCYLGVLVVLLWLENWLLFHPTPAARYWLPPPTGLVVEDVALTSADGTALHGWWWAPPKWRPEQGALLYCHGNAGNLSGRGEGVGVWGKQLGLAVLIFDYPGYGRSAGKPTEASCYASGEAAYAWLTATKGIRGEDVVLYGGSLGGAIATELAARHACRALVLFAPFTSFPDMAQKSFPFLPARWLVRNKLDNLSKIGSIDAPVFIVHGTADTLVPFSQGERLYAAAREPKQLFPLVGQGHEEGPSLEAFEHLHAFLRKHAPRAK